MFPQSCLRYERGPFGKRISACPLDYPYSFYASGSPKTLLWLYISGGFIVCFHSSSRDRLITPRVLTTTTDEASPLQPLVTCSTLDVNQLLSICWIVLTAYDAGTHSALVIRPYLTVTVNPAPGILVLIATQAMRTFNLWGNVPLTRVIYRDGERSLKNDPPSFLIVNSGIIYFAYLFCGDNHRTNNKK